MQGIFSKMSIDYNKNNHFKVIYKNEGKDMKLPIGSYEISAINAYIQKLINLNTMAREIY